MFRFAKFLLAYDRLGHSFNLNYRGSQKYSTWFGTLLTLTIYVLVIIILVNKSVDLVTMKVPTVQIFKRPLFKEEVEKTG